ncbi:polyketide synthase [Xylariaceae sp. FL0255]|nr:polyketide synthase [Xylariaceae sp. FL0255]
MDPQQRGMMECVYRALENAGIPLEAAAGTQTGVYVGCFSSDYRSIMEKDLDQDLKYASTGNVVSMLSNRVSWFYDFKGPSLTIDTACSSSLVAANQACNSLKLRETSMAIVAGCNLILSHEFSMTLDKGGVLGPDGICRSFDEKGNGYGRGEGIGVIVLKRVSDCIRDGDTIRAIIRNSGSNQDGRSPGLTQPTKASQADLIRQVYANAGLDLSLTRFFEAHGTGTAVGDPIETSAIGELFAPYRSRENPLYIGALKSNVGHLEGASGVAAIIKGVYTLENGVIPANTWLDKLNPKIQDSWNLAFPTKALPWPQSGLRRMSINSFGVGGTNAHIVLDDALHFLKRYHLVGNHRTLLNAEIPHRLSPIKRSGTNGVHTNGHHHRHNCVHSPLKNGNHITGPYTNGAYSKGNHTNGSYTHGTYTSGTHINGDGAPVNGNHTNGIRADKFLTNGFHVSGVHTNDAHTYEVQKTGLSLDTAYTDGVYTNVNGLSEIAQIEVKNRSAQGTSTRLYVWSSYDQDGLERVRDLLVPYLDRKSPKRLSASEENIFLKDLSYTLAKKRTHHSWRTFALAETRENLLDALSAKPLVARAISDPCRAFIFTGQGAQWATMGKSLMTYSVFQQSLYEADRYLSSLGCPWSLIFELLREKENSRINDAEFSQPLCTALQVALVDLLFSWGVTPHSIAGHSSGEIAAGYAAGFISRESAWKIAYYRGKLCAKLAVLKAGTKTGMAAVALNEEEAEVHISHINAEMEDGTLEIACMNSPDSHTISGDLANIEALVSRLTSEKIFARKLNVEMAYHSRHMKPIYQEYVKLIGHVDPGVKPYQQEVRFYSSTRGAVASAEELRQPSYWADNLVSPVRFSEAVLQMIEKPELEANETANQKISFWNVTDMLEIGPHNALQGPIRTIIKASNRLDVIKLHSMLKRNQSAVQTALEAVGSLWARGHRINLEATNTHTAFDYASSMLTDLPSYPFNHSTEYWFESRISRGSRQPKHARHELLGAPVPDWNKNVAIWRHRISVTDNPWLEDHRVFGDILYPAAGMLVMAIEASRQTADPTKILEGFKFSEVSFHQAFKIPDDGSGVESHFYLRPCTGSGSVHGRGWSEFQLFTMAGEEWVEHCRGFINVEYETQPAALTNGWHETSQVDSYQSWSGAKGFRKLQRKAIYNTFQSIGNEFGPCFQTLDNIWVGPDLTVRSRVKNLAKRIKATMPYQRLQPHIIHPASLDGVIQANLVPLLSHPANSGRAFVPFYARELWVSAKSLAANDSYIVRAKAEWRGPQKSESNFDAISEITGSKMAHGDGFVLIQVPGSTLHSNKQSRHIAFQMNWRVDPAFLTPLAIVDGSVDKSAPAYSLTTIESLSLHYIQKILNSDIMSRVGELQPHHQKYIAYMKQAVENTTLIPTEYDVDYLKTSPQGALIVAVGEALPRILTGETDPLEVLFGEKLADDVYQRGFGAERCFAQLNSYLDTLIHKNPAMSILEIGAGTGGTTKSITKTLNQYEGRYQEYCFTDISPAFFEEARKLFDDPLSRMSYKVLNIEKDIEEQGFEPEQYDVIVAGNVLHATQNIELTLRNTRKLLKPGGKLMLYECTSPTSLNPNLVFGTLPGWWLSEEPHRSQGPLMSTERWGDHLQATGFSGLDAVFTDFPDPSDHFLSVMVSTAAIPPQQPVKLDPVFIIKLDGSSSQSDMADKMHSALSREAPCMTVDLTQIREKGFQKSTCMLLTDLESPILKNSTPEVFASIKHIISRSSKILWLSRDGGVNPDHDMLTGFLRALRVEHPQLSLIHISFDNIEDVASIVEKSLGIFRKSYSSTEQTFRIVKGSIQIPRIVTANHISEHVQAQTRTLEAVEHPLGETPRALALQVGALSQLDSLCFGDDPIFDTPLADHNVEIEVMAAGMSSRDLASVLGQVDDDVILGYDVAGTVARAGANSNLKVGDKVFGLSTTGTIKTYARTQAAFLSKIPESMTWSEAASVPFSYSSAYAVLVELGSIQEGDSILIHSAASDFGHAAVQMAQRKGAEVFVTAEIQTKRDFLHAKHGIPHDHIFSSEDLDFKKGILQLTQSRGVDIVLNTLSGDAIMASWNCIAPFGRFVDLRTKESVTQSSLSLTNLGRNTRFEQFDYLYLMKKDPVRAQRIFQRAMRHFLAECSFKFPAPNVYSFSQVKDAFRDIQGQELIGKVVLEPRHDDVVSIMPSGKPTSSFDPDASFVIVGGLSGLGAAIARWMISRGAKNLILLSRSGPARPEARELLDDLRPLCQSIATPACDVADETALRRCIDECLTYMPKLKGCIQGSMVLRDDHFVHMSLEDWNDAIRSKVPTSWNLHKVIGNDLDFFVMLSSTMGIVGNKGQSNYAAGNTFQDSLAHYRRSQGLPAVSLNLPAIEDQGFVAEKPELLESLRAGGNGSMPVAEVIAVLDYHCGGSKHSLLSKESQIILRPGLPHELAVAGISEPAWMRFPMFSQFHQLAPTSSGAGQGSTSKKEIKYATILGAATSIAEAENIVLEAVLLKLSRVLSVDLSNLDPSKPLHIYGVDSLVAVDVRAWLLKDLGSDVSVFDMNSQTSISHLAKTATAKNRFIPVFEEKTDIAKF